MYSFKHRKDITTEKEMMAFLKSLQSVNSQGPIAIVGGHFMLFYDKDEDCLKPLIYQDLNNEKHIAFAKLMAGDFPVRTFEHSTRIIDHLQNKGIIAKNVLLVNDHLFQSEKFQPAIQNLIANRGGKLRSKFYRGENSIPSSFISVLKDYGNKKKSIVFLENNDISRDVKSVLPKKTIFFSEQFLRNRFENHLKKRILNYKGFTVTPIGKKNDVFFSDNNKKICLTENGQCGCSSEIMEFIWSLKMKGFDDIIMFIPNECELQVNNGVEVTLKQFKYEFSTESRIIIVTGLGGMENSTKNKKPRVFIHNNLPGYEESNA